MDIIVNTSYTEIYAGGGNFLTQSAHTNFHGKWTQKILVGDETPEDFMEVTAAEMDAIEAKDAKWEKPPQWLIDQFNIMAKDDDGYNEYTGYFELNGLNDITAGQACDILSAGPLRIMSYGYAYQNTRTNLPCRVDGKGTLILSDAFQHSALEVAVLPTGQWWMVDKIGNLFYYCRNLKRVINPLLLLSGLNYNMRYAFVNCINLEYVEIDSLNCDLFLNDSPKLTLDSICYIVNHAKPTKAISIFLHPNAYARVTDEVFEAALAKNIVITTTE